MKRLFLLLLILEAFVPTKVSAQTKSDLIDTTEHYSFHLNYWFNMHHFLWTEAFLNVKADSSIVNQKLKTKDQSKLNTALSYYKETLVDQDLRRSDYMSAFKKWITGVPDFNAVPSEFQIHMNTLTDFDEVYKKVFWPAQQKEIMEVFNEHIQLIRTIEDSFVERITKLTRHFWQFDPPRVRVDLSYFAKTTTRSFSSNPYTTSFPTHVVMNVAGKNDIVGNWLELLFHESAHGLILGRSYFVAGTIKDLAEAENLKLPRSLEHVFLFYFTGKITKDLLKEQGIDYPKMYMERGVYSQYYSLLEKHLQPYIDREVSLTTATRNFLAELNDIQSEVETPFEIENLTADSIHQVVLDYSQGFIDADFNRIRNSIGDQLIMINGNFSGEPANWQAHQFLNGREINQWITMMLENVRPFENEIILKNIDIRGNSAVAVTEEKGMNKFRSWEKEEVAYMLGKAENEWRIVGIFIKNIKNPE